MTTDHTKTITHEEAKSIAGWAPSERRLKLLTYIAEAEKTETELAQARAALATAMEERDEARAQRDEALSQLKTLGEELEEATVGQVIAENQATDLRARNDALTKALEAHHDHDLEVCEVHFKTEDGIDPIATDLGEAYADSQLCIDTVAALKLGKEGL